MNVFVGQSVQTTIELEEIAAVERQLITPTTSKTIIGIVQDGLLGAYNLTSPTVRIDWRSAMNIISYTSLEELSLIKKDKEYTGAELYSLIIPPGINVSRATIKIKNGQLIEGRLTNDVLGAKKKNNLVQLIWDAYGVEDTRKFVDNTQRLINNFNLWHGFSIGIADTEVSKEVRDEIDKMFQTKELKIEHIITEMENNPDFMKQDLYEFRLFSELNIVRDDVSKLIVQNLNPLNGFNVAATSGAKGDAINIGQMAGCVGFQAFEGKNMPKKYNGRTLPYYHQNDDRAVSRGLVKQSFIRGLEYPEFVFHLMASRLGIIEQAIKSVTGDTKIFIKEDNIIKQVEIGEWIDRHLVLNNANVKHETDKNMELLKLNTNVMIPTTCEFGNISWESVELITRHDHDNELYRVVTDGGREVIIVKSKSLLIWDEEKQKYEQKLTEHVTIGDHVPVTLNLNKIDDKLSHKCFVNGFVEGSCFDETVIEEQYEMIINNNYNEIVGFLTGFFKHNSQVENNKIILITELENTRNFINMLLSRIGVYARLVGNNLVIENEWIKIFRSKIDIVDPETVEKLDNITDYNKIGKNKRIQINDTILEKIVSITKLNKEELDNYPKVYDLTIPKTLNFGLANGLHVVDTAETGYAQRKLIKSMEDIMIKYDCTVRSANDRLIQLVYGDSGVDTTKQSDHVIKLIEMNNNEVKDKFVFTSQELKNLDFSESDNEKLYKTIVDMRDIVRESVRKAKMSYLILVSNFMLPVNLVRIVDTTMGDSNLKSKDKLTPKYILERLETLLENKMTSIMCMTDEDKNNKDSIKVRDETQHKIIFKTAIYDMLSPKKVLIERQMNKAQFDTIINEISKKFNKNIAEPGEMVGIIAAQSAGEPLTQLSILGTSRVMLKNKNTDEIFYGQVQEFIDNLLTEHKKNVVKLKQKDSVVCDIDDYQILSVSKHEKVKWKDISQISRHPPNGDLLEITTSTGRIVTTTKAHSHLKRTETKIVPIKGSDLKIGDRIPVVKKIPECENPLDTIEYEDMKVTLTKDFGWLCGAYIADGDINGTQIRISKVIPEYQNKIKKIVKKLFDLEISIETKYGTIYDGTKEYKSETMHFKHKSLAHFLKFHFGNGSYNKKLSGFVFGSTLEFVSGLISGYFDGDGNVQADDKNHCSIRANSRSKQLIDDMSILCSYFGMFGSILEEFRHKENVMSYTLSIQKRYAKTFLNEIGLIVNDKKNELKELIKLNELDKKCNTNFNDMIPELGNVIATIGKELKLKGQSRTYGRWTKKEAIGIDTLTKYYKVFEKELDNCENETIVEKLTPLMKILNQALKSDVVWDKITKIKKVKCSTKYVYDFSVPGTESFLTGNGVFTHNTLNSVDWKEKILIKDKSLDKAYVLEIGKFIDNLLKENKSKVEQMGDNKKDEMGDIYYLDTKDKKYYIPSVNENGVVEWKKIEAVTKHLPINKDGTNTLVHVTTKSGKEVTATKAKSFLTRIDNKIVPIRGDEIQIGTYLPIMNKITGDETYNNFENNQHENESSGCDSDVWYDQIVSIEEVNPTKEYVYDFTVEDNKTFALHNSLLVMDSFHHSGIATLSSTIGGVPRYKELSGVSKKPKTPSMTIHLLEEFASNKDMAHKIASYIKHTTLADVRGGVNVYYDSKNTVMEQDGIKQVFYQHKAGKSSCQQDVTGLPWLLRIELDREKMLEKEVTLLDIKSKFCSWWEKRYSENKLIKKEIKRVVNKVTQMAVLSNTDNDKQPLIHIRFNVKDSDKEKEKFDLGTINDFIEHIVDTFKLKGINSVTDIPAIQEEKTIVFNKETGNVDKKTRHVIYTTGVNLIDIRYLVGIDLTKTISNHVVEVYDIFGIEIARAVLLRELTNAYEKAGGAVNYQHISIIVDQMTCTGMINSIDRHGMNKSDSDPLSRASFEKTVEQLLTAAVYGETDHMKGVSSRIMAGCVVKGGTGYCDLQLDTEMIEKSEYVEGIDTKKYTELNTGTLAGDIIKNKGKKDVFKPV